MPDRPRRAARTVRPPPVGIEHVQPRVAAFQPFGDRRAHLAETQKSHIHVPPPAGMMTHAAARRIVAPSIDDGREANGWNAGRQGRRGHRRGTRHRARDGDLPGRERRQGGGERRRRRGDRRGPRCRPGRAGGGRDHPGERRRPGGGEHRQRRRVGERAAHRADRDRQFRPHRHGGEQRRHPARPHLPLHDARGMGRGDEGAPVRRLLRQPRRGAAFPQAGERLLRAHHLARRG